jgi:hypothetical protein
VEIESEAGAMLRIIVPWANGARVITDAGEFVVKGGLVEITTKRGERIRLVANA